MQKHAFLMRNCHALVHLLSLYFICANFKFFLTYVLITIAVGQGEVLQFYGNFFDKINQRISYLPCHVLTAGWNIIQMWIRHKLQIRVGRGQWGNSFFSFLLCVVEKRFNVQLSEPSNIERQHVQMSRTNCDHVSSRITAQSQPMKVQPHTRTHNSFCSSF